jgi:hypothetical protein
MPASCHPMIPWYAASTICVLRDCGRPALCACPSMPPKGLSRPDQYLIKLRQLAGTRRPNTLQKEARRIAAGAMWPWHKARARAARTAIATGRVMFPTRRAGGQWATKSLSAAGGCDGWLDSSDVAG